MTTRCVRPAQPDGRRRRSSCAEIVFVQVLTLFKLHAEVVTELDPPILSGESQSSPAAIRPSPAWPAAEPPAQGCPTQPLLTYSSAADGSSTPLTIASTVGAQLLQLARR